MYKTNKLSWTGIYSPLCPPNKDVDAPEQPFSNDGEHGNAIDLIISMMKKGNGDLQTLKQPEVMINGNTVFFNNTHTFPNKYII
jgi:hypothetical protein